MSGIQEILLIALIVLGLFFLPRILPRQPNEQLVQVSLKMSRKMRMAIAASLIYPAIAAAYFKPWQKDPFLFVYAGLGPVALGWLLKWVIGGFKNR